MRALLNNTLTLDVCLKALLTVLVLTRIDWLVDWVASHHAPLLFYNLVYPVDIAGFFEFAGAALVLWFSHKRKVGWLSAGVLTSFALAFAIITSKLL